MKKYITLTLLAALWTSVGYAETSKIDCNVQINGESKIQPDILRLYKPEIKNKLVELAQVNGRNYILITSGGESEIQLQITTDRDGPNKYSDVKLITTGKDSKANIFDLDNDVFINCYPTANN